MKVDLNYTKISKCLKIQPLNSSVRGHKWMYIHANWVKVFYIESLVFHCFISVLEVKGFWHIQKRLELYFWPNFNCRVDLLSNKTKIHCHNRQIKIRNYLNSVSETWVSLCVIILPKVVTTFERVSRDQVNSGWG